MRTTAIFNLKGGVAKTATTVNTAAILAHDHGKRVLVIDADSQCNTTEFFGGAQENHDNLADMLRRLDGVNSENGCIIPTSFPGVDMVAADDSLMDLDLSKVEGKGVDVACIAKLTGRVSSLYDYVLIDCPPAFNAATAAALVASDDVIIPIKLDAFALRGMANLMRQIQNMKAINKKLKVAGILPTMWYSAHHIITAENALRESGLNVFPRIRRSNTVDNMTFAQEPLLACSKNSGAGRDYRAFVEKYVAGGEH